MMCLLLCARPCAREWFDLPQAVAHRQSLQTQNSRTAEVDEEDATASPVYSVRLAWMQLHFEKVMQRQRARKSAAELTQPRHNTLKAIANAWRSLLGFIGWRTVR
jgi:hypothetical protein